MRQMLKEFEEKPAEITEQSRLDLQGLSRKEQRRIKKEQLAETISDMTPFQKFKYLLYFYKELIIVAIIVFAALWFITSNAYRVTRPVTISYSIINCGDSLEFHPEPFTEYAEAIGKGKGYQIKGDSNVVITGEENSGKYEANINGEIFVNFMNLVGSDYYDVLFTDDVAAKFCTNVDVFTPLNEYLDADTYNLVKDHIVTFKDSKGNTIEAVVDVSDTAFAKSLNVGYDKVYIGFPGKQERNHQAVKEFLEYLYK